MWSAQRFALEDVQKLHQEAGPPSVRATVSREPDVDAEFQVPSGATWAGTHEVWQVDYKFDTLMRLPVAACQTKMARRYMLEKQMVKDAMDLVLYSMDGVLLALGLWMAAMAYKIGLKGVVGRVVVCLVFGSLILGLAHLLETVVHHISWVNEDHNEIFHRGVVTASMIFYAAAIRGLSKAFGGGK